EFGQESTRVAMVGEVDHLLADTDEVEKYLPAPPPSGRFQTPTLPEPGSKLPSGRFGTPSGRFAVPAPTPPAPPQKPRQAPPPPESRATDPDRTPLPVADADELGAPPPPAAAPMRPLDVTESRPLLATRIAAPEAPVPMLVVPESSEPHVLDTAYLRDQLAF